MLLIFSSWLLLYVLYYFWSDIPLSLSAREFLKRASSAATLFKSKKLQSAWNIQYFLEGYGDILEFANFSFGRLFHGSWLTSLGSVWPSAGSLGLKSPKQLAHGFDGIGSFDFIFLSTIFCLFGLCLLKQIINFVQLVSAARGLVEIEAKQQIDATSTEQSTHQQVSSKSRTLGKSTSKFFTKKTRSNIN